MVGSKAWQFRRATGYRGIVRSIPPAAIGTARYPLRRSTGVIEGARDTARAWLDRSTAQPREVEMTRNQLVGALGLTIGAVFLMFAYNGSNAPIDQLSNTLTGRFTDQTMWQLGIGIVASVGGLLVLLFGRRGI